MKQVLTTALLLFAFADPVGLFAQGGRGGGLPQGLGRERGGGGQQGRGGGRFGLPSDTGEQPAGTAVIRGRVLTADTGTPVRRARVRAALANNRNTRLVTTDEQGNFEFRDLAGGRWDVTASKAGFLTMRFGQRRSFEAGRPIEIADAEIMERVNFLLPRGSAINGRLLDEFGDPVARARVQALRYQLVQGTRRLTPIGQATQSDDRGVFRLYGLMPGEYYVSALLRAPQVDEPDDATGYAPTYLPWHRQRHAGAAGNSRDRRGGQHQLRLDAGSHGARLRACPEFHGWPTSEREGDADGCRFDRPASGGLRGRRPDSLGWDLHPVERGTRFPTR